MPAEQDTPSGESDHGEADHDQFKTDLYTAISCLDTGEEAARFMVDLCTPAELRALAGRWYVARRLDAGDCSYRDLNEATGISTATIGRVARFLRDEPHQGYALVLGRLKEAENDRTPQTGNPEQRPSGRKQP